MTLRDLHATFAWVVVAANAVVGCWALAAHHRPELRGRALWPATLVAEVGIFLEVGLGVGLVAAQGHEVAQMHAFYGFVAMATVGIVYSYRQQLAPHQYLLYGLGGLFLMGLVLRALTLSPVPRP